MGIVIDIKMASKLAGLIYSYLEEETAQSEEHAKDKIAQIASAFPVYEKDTDHDELLVSEDSKNKNFSVIRQDKTKNVMYAVDNEDVMNDELSDNLNNCSVVVVDEKGEAKSEITKFPVYNNDNWVSLKNKVKIINGDVNAFFDYAKKLSVNIPNLNVNEIEKLEQFAEDKGYDFDALISEDGVFVEHYIESDGSETARYTFNVVQAIALGFIDSFELINH